MKRFLPIAAIAILAACGGGNVQAQTIDSSFKAQNGDIVNLENAVYVARVGTNITIGSSTTTPTSVIDGDASLYNKLTADSWFTDKFVRGGPTTYWYKIDQVVMARCSAGKTSLYFTGNVPQALISDNCSAYYQIQARSK